MARLIRLLGIVSLGFVIACGSEDSTPGGSAGGSAGSSGANGSSGASGSAGSSGAGGTSGSAGTSGAGGTDGSAGSGGSGGTGGSTGGTDGSGGTGGSTGGTGGTGGSTGVGGTAGVSGTGGTGGVSTQYPPGPYGKMVGNTIENYQFAGWVNDAGSALSNTLPVTDYSLDDARRSGGRYALIHLSAFYCAGCRSAGQDLGDLAAPVQAAGGRVIEVLFTATVTGTTPSAELGAWVTSYDLKVSTVAPKTGNTLVASAADREHAFIVDLSTMKIVWTAFGSYGTTTNSSAKQGLVEMQRLLATP